MPQQPQRPFVPHRTPKTARPLVTGSEFRLYRPFLPGSQRERIELVATMGVPQTIESVPSPGSTLRPIEDFLADESFELPPVEHFLDPLPVVEQFAPDSEGALSDAWPASNEPSDARAPTTDPSESGWAETDWQSFDWRAAAALGDNPDAEASNAWASTDWEGPAAPPRDARPSAAQALASALDQIAQQIREGELAVRGTASAPNPAKIAETLAALLGVKR